MRLQFGNPEHLELLGQAPKLVSEYQSLTRPPRRFRVRRWWKAKSTCFLCDARLKRDEQFILLGDREVHDRCLVTRLIELRRKLTALGYRISPGGGASLNPLNAEVSRRS
jgi:hypothetical protein